jgi:hypothetical protein
MKPHMGARELTIRDAMANLCNVDGRITPEAEAHVPVLDRGFLFGDSIYEVVRTVGAEPFGWPEHWIDTLGARIAKLHIKDFSRKKRDNEGLWKGFDVELGEGDAGWDRTMKALDRVGYSTDPRGLWATAEVRGGNEERLKQISTQMDALFAKGM